MHPALSRVEPTTRSEYAFPVRGRLSPDHIQALHPLEPEAPVTETAQRGEVADQAAMHGLIACLEQLGVRSSRP
jgi:hypothetical protein